jgi:hypothetical protein
MATRQCTLRPRQTPNRLPHAAIAQRCKAGVAGGNAAVALAASANSSHAAQIATAGDYTTSMSPAYRGAAPLQAASARAGRRKSKTRPKAMRGVQVASIALALQRRKPQQQLATSYCNCTRPKNQSQPQAMSSIIHNTVDSKHVHNHLLKEHDTMVFLSRIGPHTKVRCIHEYRYYVLEYYNGSTLTRVPMVLE